MESLELSGEKLASLLASGDKSITVYLREMEAKA